MMVKVDDMRVMRIMADATNRIAEGEVMQLLNCHDPDTTEARYTGSHPPQDRHPVRGRRAPRRGHRQSAPRPKSRHWPPTACTWAPPSSWWTTCWITAPPPRELGKNVGDDLAEGKPTLPLIHAMRMAAPAQREMIRKAITDGGREHIDGILDIIHKTGALEYTYQCAQQQARKAVSALKVLSDSVFKTALLELVDFSLERRS